MMRIVMQHHSSDDDERRALAHRLMEEALILLDRTRDSVPAIHLDHAIATLGLRGPHSSVAQGSVPARNQTCLPAGAGDP
jgi:hypothetical protein